MNDDDFNAIVKNFIDTVENNTAKSGTFECYKETIKTYFNSIVYTSNGISSGYIFYNDKEYDPRVLTEFMFIPRYSLDEMAYINTSVKYAIPQHTINWNHNHTLSMNDHTKTDYSIYNSFNNWGNHYTKETKKIQIIDNDDLFEQVPNVTKECIMNVAYVSKDFEFARNYINDVLNNVEHGYTVTLDQFFDMMKSYETLEEV